MKKPNFFIVGAPKCGTTAMYEFLKPHPDVFLPIRKEINYFGQDFNVTPNSAQVDSLDHYLRLFENVKNETFIGDTSSFYLYSKTASQEIRDFAPSSKIIVMLRNPVDVMYSFYHQALFNGSENIESFEEALEAEPARKEGKRLPPEYIVLEGLFYRSLVDFVPQIQRYFDRFGRDQTLILLQEDLHSDPEKIYKQTLSFLGASTAYVPDFRLINTNKVIRYKWLRSLYRKPVLVQLSRRFPYIAQRAYQVLRSVNTKYVARERMSDELRSKLLDEFRPAIHDLGNLIGRDLGHWTKTK